MGTLKPNLCRNPRKVHREFVVVGKAGNIFSEIPTFSLKNKRYSWDVFFSFVVTQTVNSNKCVLNYHYHIPELSASSSESGIMGLWSHTVKA